MIGYSATAAAFLKRHVIVSEYRYLKRLCCDSSLFNAGRSDFFAPLVLEGEFVKKDAYGMCEE